MRLLKLIIGGLVILATVLLGLYISIWWGIIEPIMHIVDAIQNDTLTAGLVGVEALKFFVKELLAGIVLWVGISVGTLIMITDD